MDQRAAKKSARISVNGLTANCASLHTHDNYLFVIFVIFVIIRRLDFIKAIATENETPFVFRLPDTGSPFGFNSLFL